MKYTKVIRRPLYEGRVDFIGQGITTKATKASTGYIGRGIVPKHTTLPAGTPVTFSLKQYRGYPDGETYSELEIAARLPDYTYKTSHRVNLPIMEAAKAVGIKQWEEGRH